MSLLLAVACLAAAPALAAAESSRYMHQQWLALEQQCRRDAEAAGVRIVSAFDRKPFEHAMKELYAKAMRDATTASLVARIRQVQ